MNIINNLLVLCDVGYFFDWKIFSEFVKVSDEILNCDLNWLLQVREVIFLRADLLEREVIILSTN